ncbi:aminoacyltransferase, partial [Enterococcus faecalis]
LQHAMMKQSIEKNLNRFNFYGIEGVYDGSDGVLNFKKGFEGVVEEQLGSYMLVTNPFKYSIYTAMKKGIAKVKR